MEEYIGIIKVIGVMILGFGVGYFLRERRKLIDLNNKLVDISIYLLLFILGIGVGSNHQILNSLGNIGLSALYITLAGVCGSVLFGFLLYVSLFKHPNNE